MLIILVLGNFTKSTDRESGENWIVCQIWPVYTNMIKHLLQWSISINEEYSEKRKILDLTYCKGIKKYMPT